jgi:A/G-specific adenine glycosylase
MPRASRIATARQALLAHFDTHRRDLPWRRTRDPYAIWVSEVMLQQTRAETVIPYYVRFMARFPTVRALGDAQLDDVLAAWSGLGYYRRARFLHAGARVIVERHGGAIPDDAESLREIPGIGRYTAGAIASIAFDRREAIVDGNVERVLTRFDAIEGDPRRAPVRETVWSLARRFADGARPGDVNQSLMEIGATMCSPVAPTCSACPLANGCAARRRGEAERFPEKGARAEARIEQWWALIATDRSRERVWLLRNGSGRWDGMLVPPMGLGEPTEQDLRGAVRCGRTKHVLTHAAMHFDVYRVVLRTAPPRGEMVPVREFGARAIPRVTRRLLECAQSEGRRRTVTSEMPIAAARNASPARRETRST